MKEFKNGKYPEGDLLNRFNPFKNFRLYRVLNDSFYYDWPWGINRINRKASKGEYYNMLFPSTINYINDLKDSVFFYGGERSAFLWNRPFPFFHNASKLGNNQMPWPWFESFYDEAIYYKNKYNNHGFQIFKTNMINWNKRVAKGAFFASLDDHHMILFDIGLLMIIA